VSETENRSGATPRGGKILFTASTRSHIENFHLPYLKAFEEMGWDVEALALPVSKRFFSLQNLRAVFALRKRLLAEGFDVVSSQSTLAGIVTRLAILLTGRAGKRMKVFHTVHGYLFWDDKSLKKWVYLLPEMLCGKVTDVLMVMNHEDLTIAEKYRLYGNRGRLFYIDGMGIDLAKFEAVRAAPPSLVSEWKRSFGIGEQDFAFVYAAEFSKRKNHSLLLRGFARALTVLRERLPEGPSGLPAVWPKLVLAGDGALLDATKALAAELGIGERVLFPGHVKNIPELCACCRAAVSASLIEGLPFNVLEAMACGLPVVASDIKGHRELIEHGVNGLLFQSGNQEQLAEQIAEIFSNPSLSAQFANAAPGKLKKFSLPKTLPRIMEIYNASVEKFRR
jgi:glycosyltransferase EpsD